MLSRVMRSTFGRTTLRIVLGQFLAMCMSVTGLFTTLLVEDKSSLPLLQSVTAYSMICVLFFFVYTFFVVRNKDYINQKYVARSSNDHLGGKDVKRPDPQQKRESQIICSDLAVSDRDDESARRRTERHRREDNESQTKNLSESSACHSNATPLIVSSYSSSSSYQQQIKHNRREREEEKETGGVNTDRNGNNIINESDMRISSEGYATFSVLSPSSPSPSPSRRPPHTSLTVNSSNSNISTSSNSKGHHELKQEDRSSTFPFISSTFDTLQQYFTSSLSSGYKGVGASLWRFAVIAFIDLEANFAVVYAYQHTDITSVQLLDCSSIVWVMILSRFLLGTRYKPLFHLVGVGVAVVGIILLIVFDATNMNRHGPSGNGDGGDDGPANMTAAAAAAVSSYFFSSTTIAAASSGGFSNSHLFMSKAKQEDPTSPQPRAPPSDHSKRDIILGDMLCLVSSLLYAISNVMCERLVKKGVENAEGDERKGREGEEEEYQEKQSEDERDEQRRGSRKEEDTVEEAHRQESDSVQQQGTLAHKGKGGKSASLLLQKEDDRCLREETSVADADAVLRTDAVIVTNRRCDDQCRDSCEDPCDGQTSVQPDHQTKYSGHQQSVTPESLACCREKTGEKNKIAIPTRNDIRDPNLCAANSSRENSRETSLLETTPDDRFVPSLEWIVIIEYLFWMPFFGALFGSIQFWATGEFKNLPQFFTSSSSESSEVPAFDRVSSGESYVDLYYQFGFGGAMLVIYTLMPVLFYVASATFANLSLLTSDIFSVFWNVVIFGIYPKPTFFVSFVLILVGVVIFDTNGLEALRQRRRG